MLPRRRGGVPAAQEQHRGDGVRGDCPPDRFERNESELVVIVTPYIVRPVSTHLAAPTDGFVTPSDLDRLLRQA